jgi:phosphoglycolate phosphatase
MKGRRYILFDLDGTLSDSGEGIVNSISHALKHFGLEGDPQILRTFVGPPLMDSFRQHFNLPEEQITEVIRIYRQHYHDHGFYQNALYEGIPELLADLLKAGKTLAVATTKAEVYAHKTLAYLGIDKFFPKELVVGAHLDGTRSNKGEVIATVLERLGGGTEDKVMVGDRKFDILGARANGLDVIAVTYGFGDREEIEAHGPTLIVDSVQDLRKLLLG